MTVPPLTAEVVIEQGGWHPRYAEVLAVAADGRLGMTLVDGNGDRADIEIEDWCCEEDGWVSWASSGGGGPWDSRGPWGVCSGIYRESGTESAFAAYGYAAGHRSILIVFDDAERRVFVPPHGFWLFVTADYPAEADAVILFE